MALQEGVAFLSDTCCRDVLHSIFGLLAPSDIMSVSLSCKLLHSSCSTRRRAVLLARTRLRTQLRQVRKILEHRSSFVSSVCTGVVQNGEMCLAAVLEHLCRSPDGIRDLSAAVQKILQRLTMQSVVSPYSIRRVHQDCVNIASFVCLLAWKSHMRSRRADEVEVVATEQPDNAPGSNDQEPQLGGEPMLPLASSSSTSAGGTSEIGNSSSASGSQAVAAAAGVARQSSRGTQTDLGSTLRESQELLRGFNALATTSNSSIKLCTATLQLLSWFLHLELLAWQPAVAVAEEAIAQVVDQAAAAAVAALEAEQGAEA